MQSVSSSNRLVLLLVLLCVGALVGAGCDGGASKRDSYFQRLVGTWTAERLHVSGINRTNLLDERYSALQIGFQSEGERRTYRITGVRADTARLAQGRVEMLSAEMLQMLPGQEFEEPVTWTFRFEGSRAIFEIPADRAAGSEEFLGTVLPRGSWGDAEHVVLELAPDDI